MIGADRNGKRVEKPRIPGKNTHLRFTGRHVEKLMVRDVAMATLANQHGWTITRLCLAFDLSRWQVSRILESIQEADRRVLR